MKTIINLSRLIVAIAILTSQAKAVSTTWDLSGTSTSIQPSPTPPPK